MLRLLLAAASLTFAAKKHEYVQPGSRGPELQAMVILGRVEKVRELLQAGEDPNWKSHGVSVLASAAREGNAEIVELLLQHGAKPNVRDDKGRTPLHHAAAKGSERAVELLLDAKADVNARDEDGRTPLLDAAARQERVAALLLGRGADPNIADKDGMTPLMLAVHRPATVKDLLIQGASTAPKEKRQGWTALHIAARHGNVESLRALLTRGADVKARNNSGQTALVLAELQGQEEAAKLLRSYEDTLAGKPKSASAEDVAKLVAEAMRTGTPSGTADVKVGSGLSSDADAPSYKLPEKEDRFALVVGVEKYSSLPEAQFAERDAQAVKSHLLALGFPERNVVTLTGQAASRAGLVKNLEAWLPRNVTEGSTVLVYYSGHGAPDVKTGQAYLVPWDGDPQFLEETAYPVKRLYQKLSELKAAKVVVALDACFSGAGGRSVLPAGARPLVTKVESAPVGPKLAVLTAAGPDEITGTEASQGHGLFTYHLLKGLNAGEASVKSLHSFLLPKVRDGARRQNRDQTPQLLGGGDVNLR